jgi:hypothetical protein
MSSQSANGGRTDTFSWNIDGVDNKDNGGARQSFPAGLANSHFVDMKAPRIMNWSLGVQQKIDSATTLDVAYVGSSAANLSRTLNYNQLPLGTLQRNPGVNANALRPSLGYANINMYVTGSNSIYNAMQMSVKRQMDSYSFKTERGLATFHRAHVFVFSYIYPLPFWVTGSEWYKKALGGWQLSGVTTIQIGLPVNLAINSDTAGIGQTGQRPNVAGDWKEGGGTLLKWFNTGAFSVPAVGTFGNLGRNVVIAPGQSIWDASLQKYFNFNEQWRLQFRAEMYNFPNHISWWGVGNTVGNANFGQITNGADPRTLQLGLRLTF